MLLSLEKIQENFHAQSGLLYINEYPHPLNNWKWYTALHNVDFISLHLFQNSTSFLVWWPFVWQQAGYCISFKVLLEFPVWITSFPVWINPFAVLKINAELLVTNEKHFVKEVFFQSSGSRRINFISCLDNYIFFFENKSEAPWFKRPRKEKISPFLVFLSEAWKWEKKLHFLF